MAVDTRSKNGQGQAYFGFRWFILAAVVVTLFVLQGRSLDAFEPLSDLVTAAAIAAGINIVIGLFIFITQLRRLMPYVVIVGDAITVFVFVSIGYNDPMIVALVTTVFLLASIQYLGSANGSVAAAGAVIAAGAAVFTSLGSPMAIEPFQPYLPSLVLVAMVALISGGWIESFNLQMRSYRQQLRTTLSSQAGQVDDMRERTRTISEMATTLNATLDIKQIMDAALDMGRIGLRKSAKQRLVGMVMLYTPDEKLRITTARGIPYLDNERELAGDSGIIGECLRRSEPVIGGETRQDPELRQWIAFRGIQSTLVIPLRARFNTYGVLLFGSEEVNAFNEDHIDTLKAIGTQVTIALQNAFLYRNLMEEKERIIEIEENGRKELVRDLHDLPTQTMSAVAMQLAIIPRQIDRSTPEEVKAEVNRIREMAVRATEEIRHVMFTLRPLALEARGLGAALEQLRDKMDKTYAQPMMVRVHPDAERYLDKKQQGTLFYLIEEAANNARKYAESDMIRVTIAPEGGFIIVRIADNGVGFDTSIVNSSNYDERGSFGMVNMRERAELVDGILEIQSEPGRGTIITVRVPIKDAAKTADPNGRSHSRRPQTKLEIAARDA